MMPYPFYTGDVFTIIFTEEAKKTYDALSAELQPNGTSGLDAKIVQFADKGKLQPKHLAKEGDDFFAIKHHNGLRAYCWYCEKQRAIVVVSHIKLKKTQKLSPADKDKMIKEREKYYGLP